MITRQFLQYEFPNFTIHHAKFATTNYYFLIKDALHFHITASDDGEIHTLVYNEGDALHEFLTKKTQEKDLIQTLKGITKEYNIGGESY